MSKRILTAGPLITQHEVRYVVDAVTRCMDEHWDDYLRRFERRLAEYLGVKHVLLTSSCTGAMHIGLLALGIGPGDEVIVPEITWVATASAVTYVGATPVFADVEPDSLCIDADSVRSLITPRTRCIMPVHLYGHPARMDRLQALAKEHGFCVLEDAAPAIGAWCFSPTWCHGRRAGTLGDFGAFSFAGAKTLATGEGGALVTNNDGLYETAKLISNHGQPGPEFWITRIGVNYLMSNIVAALGLGQLEHIEDLLDKKQQIYKWYDEGLAGVPHLRFCREAKWSHSAYWMNSVILDEDSPISRDDLRRELDKRNIDTRSIFPAISQYPIWGRKIQPQPVALGIGERGMNLPSAVRLSHFQIRYVCESVREIMETAGG